MVPSSLTPWAVRYALGSMGLPSWVAVRLRTCPAATCPMTCPTPTFVPLVALAGAICMFLGSGIYMVALLVIGAYGVAGYMRNDPGDVGLTGEVALLVNMVLAGLAMQRPELAVPLGVVVAVLLQAKQQLRTISRQLISEQEVRDGMVLLVAGLVIMPLLGLWLALSTIGLGWLVAPLLRWSIEALAAIGETVAGWPGASLQLAAMPGAALALLLAGGLLIALLVGRARWIGAPVVLAGAAAMKL